MAELSDWITCPGTCGRQYDRNVMSMCTSEGCYANLWDVVTAKTSVPTPATSLEPQSASKRIEVVIEGERYVLEDGQKLRLGRDDALPTARALHRFDNVSGEHAELRNDGGRLFVIDKKPSTNGTFVDGERLPPQSEYEIRSPQTLRLASRPPVYVEIVWSPT